MLVFYAVGRIKMLCHYWKSKGEKDIMMTEVSILFWLLCLLGFFCEPHSDLQEHLT